MALAQLKTAARIGTGLPPLSGTSGAQLRYVEAGPRLLVRKSAATAADNASIRRLGDRHRRWAEAGMAVPAFRGAGEAEGLDYFDLDVIYGETVAAALRETPQRGVPTARLVRALVDLLESCRTLREGTIPEGAVQTEIALLRRWAQGHGPLAPHRTALEAIFDRLARADWSGIPESPAHGRLTLDNIMIDAPGEVVFVGLWESALSSYWFDAGTLFQDLRGLLALRGPLPAPQFSRLRLFELDLAVSAVLERMVPKLHRRLNALAALSGARTLLGLAEPREVDFTLSRLEVLLG